MTTATYDRAEILRLHGEGKSQRDIAQELGCGKSTVERAIKEAGINVLIAQASTGNTEGMPLVDLASIKDNPWQTRAIDEEFVAELADSIESVGLLEPMLGRPMDDGTVQQATGHHRVAAIRRLVARGAWEGGVPMLVRSITDENMALSALEENDKRKNPNPYQQLLAYQKALDEIEGLTIQALADRLGKDRSTLSNDLRVLRLPKEVLDLVASGDIPVRSAREFLCLVAEDHNHLDVMQSIIRRISQVPMGTVADWRAANVRRLLWTHISGSRVSEWRRLEKGKGFFGSSHEQAPTFDVDAFQAELPQKVHHIPTESKDGSNLWTCGVNPWKKWQDGAKSGGNGAGAAVKEKPAPKGLRHLVQDPVGKKVLKDAVSEETAAKTLGAELLEKETASETPAAGKTLAWQQLNDHLIKFLGSHANKDSRDNLRTSAAALSKTLKLEEAGLLVKAVANAINKAVDDFEKEIAKRIKLPTELSAEAAEELGTRAKVVEVGYNSKGHSLELGAYGGAPPFFPDLNECLKTCTFGATYTTTPYSKAPTLRCMNEVHWQEKLDRGLEAYKRKLQERIDLDDDNDEITANAILGMMPESLGLPMAVVLLGRHRVIDPNVPEDKGFRMPELAYTPVTLKTVNRVLGIDGPKGTGQLPAVGVSSHDALKALDTATPADCAMVASRLLTWSLRNNDNIEFDEFTARFLGEEPADVSK